VGRNRALFVFLAIPPQVTIAQTMNLVATPAGTATYLAVPAGAKASAGDSKGGAGIFGVQIWQRDSLFLSAFASVGAEQTVTEKFGGYVLNPSNEGSSFQLSGHRVVWKSRGSTSPALFNAGVSGRATFTLSNWKVTSGQTVSESRGLVTSLTPALRLATKTFERETTTDEKDEYQLAFEIGPTWRFIGGDVGHEEAFRTMPQVLSAAKTSYAGLEWSISFRVNAWQPFARFTWIPQPGTGPIRGLTGTQAVIGVDVVSALFKTKVKD
jgi:hypothetical protein